MSTELSTIPHDGEDYEPTAEEQARIQEHADQMDHTYEAPED